MTSKPTILAEWETVFRKVRALCRTNQDTANNESRKFLERLAETIKPKQLKMLYHVCYVSKNYKPLLGEKLKEHYMKLVEINKRLEEVPLL